MMNATSYAPIAVSAVEYWYTAEGKLGMETVKVPPPEVDLQCRSYQQLRSMDRLPRSIGREQANPMLLTVARYTASPLNLQKADSTTKCKEVLTITIVPYGIVRCSMSKCSHERGKKTSKDREY
jgi:hypothetical protein